MDRRQIELKTGSWCGDKTVALAFPGHWQIRTHEANVRPPLSVAEIESRLRTSAEGFSLESLLRPDKSVAIVVDDHSRPTPVAEILQPLLRLLNEKGIPNERITVLVAIGTHILREPTLLARKLQGVADAGVRVVVPDCRDSGKLDYVGDSNDGVPVYVNREFAAADVKIAVSGVYPHDEAGFSGGGKILIGLLGLETLSRFHRSHGLVSRGSVIETDFRHGIEHIADLAGLDCGISCVVNPDKTISGLYCGDFRLAFRSAAEVARQCFGTPTDPDADVVISNAYPLDTSLCVLGKSRWPFNGCTEGVHRVLVTSLCEDSSDRIPLASSRGERLLQRLKRATGFGVLKRRIYASVALRALLRNPDRKWQRPYVICAVHVDGARTRKARIIDSCYVEYDWENILSDLLRRFGTDTVVRVSVYLHAPVLYPIP